MPDPTNNQEPMSEVCDLGDHDACMVPGCKCECHGPANNQGEARVEQIDRSAWPAGISDGLSLACSDCGVIPRFDYRVTDEFWREYVPEKPARLSVVCLPCLDRRCGGVGLAAALEFVQWTGTRHTVELTPARAFEYGDLTRA